MSIDNPFFHRGAIRQADAFFGRNNELNEVLGLLRNGQSVSIIGPRRIGKSSLLLHLSRPEVRGRVDLGPAKAFFVLVDCQELGGSPSEEVYDALYTGLLDSAAMVGITIPSSGSADPYRELDRAINYVSQQGYSVVILLDEFELLAANEKLTTYFFARLRGLTTKYGLAYITASQRALYAITADEQVLSSPFFNIFVTISLGLFTPEDGRALLQERMKGAGISFSAELSDYLLTIAGSHPFFLHIAGYHAFQLLSQGVSISYDELERMIEREAESHFSYIWSNLSADEQYTLATFEGSTEIVHLLEQQSLIILNKQVGYQYSNALLNNFVRRQKVQGLIQAGPFIIDAQKHLVKVHGQPLNLTNSQFAILLRMAEAYNQVVLSEELEVAVWGEILVDDPDRLKTLIKRVRRAIEPYSDWIASERGAGYILRPPDPNKIKTPNDE